MSWKWKGQGRDRGREKRSAAAQGAIRERERQTIHDHGCQQPKDSYADWVEMRCGTLIYTRVARDWRK